MDLRAVICEYRLRPGTCSNRLPERVWPARLDKTMIFVSVQE